MKPLFIFLCLFVISLDAGAQNWTRTNGPVEDDVLDLCIDSNGILYAVTPLGVNRSTDGGELWTRPFLFSRSSDTSHMFVARNGTIIATANSGIFISTDGGDSFIAKVESSTPVLHYAISASGRIFVTTKTKLLLSDDHGEQWSEFSHAYSFRAIAAAHDTVIAHHSSASKVSYSVNNGDTWDTLEGVPPSYVQQILIHPDGSWYILMRSLGLYHKPVEQDDWNFFWFIDGAYSADVMRDGSMFFGTRYGLQLLRNGVWTDISSGFKRDASNLYYLVSRVIEDPIRKRYYAATRGDGVWKSTSASLSVHGERLPSSFHVTPNPARERVTIEYTVSEPKPVTIKLYDMLGRTLWKRTEIAVSGQNITYFDAESLLPGTYLIVLEMSGEVKTQWVTIQ